jgi:hypothetical protein
MVKQLTIGKLLLLFIVLMSSCGNDGQEETFRYDELQDFTEVELNSVFDVYLQQDTLHSIRIVGSEKAVSHISYRVDSGVLRMADNAKLKWLSPRDNRIKVYLSALQFNSILVNEASRIQSVNTIESDQLSITMGPKTKLNEINLDLDVDSFTYWNNHQCGGNMKLGGKATHLTIYTFALMSVDAGALTVTSAFVDNSSLGDCEIFVTDRLEYSIHGLGNIYLHGNPQEIILRESSSSGQLVILD